MLSRRNQFACLLLACAMLASCLWILRNVRAGQNDFLPFYCGGRLAGTGALYDYDRMMEVQQELTGHYFPAMAFVRPAWNALVFVPFAALPLMPAFWLYTLTQAAAVLYWWFRFGRQEPQLAFLMVVYPPVYSFLFAGQDVGWLLLAATAAYLLVDRGRDFSAGLILALLSGKAHVFLFVPLVLLYHRRWRALAGGAAGGAVLFLLGFVAAGPGWVQAWWRQVQDPRVSPGDDVMPTVGGLLRTVAPGAGPWLWWVMAAGVALLFLGALSRLKDWRLGFALALPAGLLASRHAYTQDCLFLLLTLAIVLKVSRSKPLRVAAALPVLPFAPLLLLAGSPGSALMPLCLIAMLGTAMLASPGFLREATASP